MQGPFVEVGNAPGINQAEYIDDGNAALYHALQWRFTGIEAHALLATEILDAWATTSCRSLRFLPASSDPDDHRQTTALRRINNVPLSAISTASVDGSGTAAADRNTFD